VRVQRVGSVEYPVDMQIASSSSGVSRFRLRGRPSSGRRAPWHGLTSIHFRSLTAYVNAALMRLSSLFTVADVIGLPVRWLVSLPRRVIHSLISCVMTFVSFSLAMGSLCQAISRRRLLFSES